MAKVYLVVVGEFHEGYRVEHATTNITKAEELYSTKREELMRKWAYDNETLTHDYDTVSRSIHLFEIGYEYLMLIKRDLE